MNKLSQKQLNQKKHIKSNQANTRRTPVLVRVTLEINLSLPSFRLKSYQLKAHRPSSMVHCAVTSRVHHAPLTTSLQIVLTADQPKAKQIWQASQ